MSADLRSRARGALVGLAVGDALGAPIEFVPLAEARAAHERLEAGEQFGKVILAIPG